ncbi:MAG: hypothetical protein K0Q76_1196 [Panacagrimonas sp.]|nr:TIGR04222 domain-containing membrane protein [Panacagrimonas sp.]MCC2656088.1 hypothetical protein [Panacagrimonas sp.]
MSARLHPFDFRSTEHAACWDRICAHLGPGAGHALDLASMLVGKFRWTRAHAEAAVEEYRRFCFLAATGDPGVSPSAEVDEVWHLHLQHTRDYWDRFCPQVLRMNLHHEPGGRSRDRDRVFRVQYAETLAHYQQVFGPPPEAFWPGTVRRFDAPPRFRAIDTQHSWILRRPAWTRCNVTRATAAAVAASAVLLALVVAPDAFALGANPLDWDGPSFLKLYLVLAAAALIAGIQVRRGPPADRASHGASLSPHEAAYLSGGAARVVDAAIADLLARGAATWEPSSQTVQVTDASKLPAPLDAIARQLQSIPDPRRALPLIEPALSPLAQTLRLRGLLLDPGQARERARRAAMPSLLLFGLGVAKIAVGISRDRPVGFLVALSIVALIMAVVFLRSTTRMTGAGRRALARTRSDHAAAMRAPRQQDMAIAVALLGTTALAGTAYAAYHDWRHPAGSSDGGSSDSGSSFSSDSSGSSSSCSSDSGGSSGCGGCGGGGD